MDRADACGQGACTIRVEVVHAAAPHDIDFGELQLPAGATVADALQASGVLLRRGLDAAAVDVGIRGRPCARDEPLRDGDRVELYRPLLVDPKEARRRRQPRHATGGAQARRGEADEAAPKKR